MNLQYGFDLKQQLIMALSCTLSPLPAKSCDERKISEYPWPLGIKEASKAINSAWNATLLKKVRQEKYAEIFWLVLNVNQSQE